MAVVENPRAVPGDNNPPPDVDPLLLAAERRVDEANRWLTERADVNLWDKEIADKAQYFIGQVRTSFDDLDAQRMEENRVHDAAQDAKYGKAGDPAKGKPGSGPLGLLKRSWHALSHMRTGYLQLEEKRLQEAARLKREEAQRAADAAAAVLAKAQAEMKKKGGDPIRAQQAAEEAMARAQELKQEADDAPIHASIKGSYTTTSKGLRTVWRAEITDRGDAMRSYKKNDLLLAAIDKALVQIATAQAVLHKDASKAPKGVRFYSERI